MSDESQPLSLSAGVFKLELKESVSLRWWESGTIMYESQKVMFQTMWMKLPTIGDSKVEIRERRDKR